MHAAAISPRGGVAPKTTCLRGQSIIEYVLIIAVIGLVIVFAGPGVAGAIRNQFNLVGNTVENGTNGSAAGGASGGGTGGADSATVQAAVAKDAKDWTLDEQRAVAEDIAAKGEASPAYAKAKAAMDEGTKWSVKLTNGKTLEYRIIDINHDDLADGSGKAGLTFLTTSAGIQSRKNATNTNAGGWEKCELRQKMNSGEIWNLMPSDFQSKVKAVRKKSVTVVYDATVIQTNDKLFLLSFPEIVGTPPSSWSGFSWLADQGFQYDVYKEKVFGNSFEYNFLAIGSSWWMRDFGSSGAFLVSSDGFPASQTTDANSSNTVCPAWCF